MEYRQIVEYLRSGQDWKLSPPLHPVRNMRSVWEELGVEDMAKGPVAVVLGTRVLVLRQERQRLLVEARHVQQCQAGLQQLSGLHVGMQGQGKAASGFPDDLLRMDVMELVRVDLMDVAGHNYIVWV